MEVGEKTHVTPHDLEGRKVRRVDVVKSWIIFMLGLVLLIVRSWATERRLLGGHRRRRRGGCIWRHGAAVWGSLVAKNL